MVIPQISGGYLILDACCVINLCASEIMPRVLAILGSEVAVALDVMNDEVQWCLELSEVGNGELEKRQIDLHALVQQGTLHITDFETDDEAEMAVNLVAAGLDSGEAASIAIAVHRRWAIASDDKKCHTLLRAIAPNTPIFTTTDLIWWWNEVTSPVEEEIRAVINRIRRLGKYVSPRSDVHHSWWLAYLDLE